MPWALAQAVADLLGTGLGCGDYRRLLAEETMTASAADPAVGDWNRRRSLLRRSQLRRVVTFLARPLRRRGRGSASDRRRHVMLKKVWRRASRSRSDARPHHVGGVWCLIMTGPV